VAAKAPVTPNINKTTAKTTIRGTERGFERLQDWGFSLPVNWAMK
jgi:hypothetical protein